MTNLSVLLDVADGDAWCWTVAVCEIRGMQKRSKRNRLGALE
ncbi:MAG: hypothetical protein ACLU2U_00185 [Bifidobacterium angulatum]